MYGPLNLCTMTPRQVCSSQSDQSVKALHVWRRLSSRHNSMLSAETPSLHLESNSSRVEEGGGLERVRFAQNPAKLQRGVRRPVHALRGRRGSISRHRVTQREESFLSTIFMDVEITRPLTTLERKRVFYSAGHECSCGLGLFPTPQSPNLLGCLMPMPVVTSCSLRGSFAWLPFRIQS